MSNTKEMKKKNGYIPWSLGAVSAGMSYLIITNLTYALTESYGMTAASVGLIFMFSRIFDGITDFIAGLVIDKTSTKWGKARPYELGFPFLWLFTLLCFCIPDFSMTGKIIWVFIVYNMSQSVFSTFISCAEPIRLKRSFEEEKRVKAVSIAAVITTVISVATSIGMPILIGIFEHRPNGWGIIVSIFAIPFSIFGLIRFFLLPENVKEEEAIRKDAEKSISVKESLKALVSNKYIFFLGGAFLMKAILSTLTTSTGNYYFTYVYGDISAAALPGMVGALGMVSVVFLSPCCQKFGSRNLCIYSLILCAVGYLMRYIAPTNLALLSVATLISGIGILPISYLRSVMVIDTMTYGQWKTGKDIEGVYASVNGVVDKLGLGLGSFIVGAILELGGYDGKLSVQPDSVIPTIKFISNALPAIICIIAVIFLIFYDLEKKMPQIKKELGE